MATLEYNMIFLKNLKVHLSYVQLFNSTYHRDTWASVFTVALFHSCQVMDPTCVFKGIRIDNENIYARGVVFFTASKKNEIMSLAGRWI